MHRFEFMIESIDITRKKFLYIFKYLYIFVHINHVLKDILGQYLQ
jgi:hypothetical protein